jgi:hypothetical protein
MTTKLRFGQHLSLAAVLVAVMFLPFSSTGCGESVNNSEDSGVPVNARAAADVRGARIFFAHQSVGANIVEGLTSVSRTVSPEIRIIESASAVPETGSFFAHAKLGQNGDPKGKTDAFVAALEGPLRNRVDVAFQKYCYADFYADSNPADVFEHYRLGMERLHRDFPGLTIVHVTTPLTIVQTGPKAWVKRVIGRAPDHYADNLVREQYNELLRRHYKGKEPIFDLAALETSRADGSRPSVTFNGSPVYALLPQYSSDGSHLNESGQARVARALVSFLGDVVEHKQPVRAE